MRQRAPKGGVRVGGKYYTGGQLLPHRYQRDTYDGERSVDPAYDIEHAPPNFGRYSVPHILSFNAIATSAAKVYRNPDEAIRHSRENALIMRRDCTVMESLEARQRGTALLNWHLEPEDSSSQDQKALCDELTKILKETPRFTEYRRNLLEATWYGKYGIEHNYKLNYRTGRKRTLISGWIPRNGDKLVFRFDDGSGQYNENQVGLRVIGHYKLGDVIAGNRRVEATENGMAYFFEDWERSRFAIHKHMIEDAAFEDFMSAGSIHGVGIRSRIYWTWVQKQECLAMLMDYIERSSKGILIFNYPAHNAEAKAEMEKLALTYNDSNVILMPRTPGDPSMDAYGIERVEPNASGSEALRQIVHEFYGHQIKRYILGQTLSTEADATGMGSGVAELHEISFQQIVHYDAANLEETITKETLGPLKDFNYPAAKNIEVRFKIDTESPEAEKKLASAERAWLMGARIKEADIMDTIGFSIPTEEDRVLENPQTMQQHRLREQAQVTGFNPETDQEQSLDGIADLAGLFGPILESLATESGEPSRYSRVGETKIVNGVLYRLNANSRWVRAMEEELAEEDPAPSLQDRLATAKKNLSQIQQDAAGLMAGIQADPEFQKSGTSVSRDIAPELAESVYNWMSQNSGQTTEGGHVVDLGSHIEGAFGYSTPAGALVIAPDGQGGWKTSYTIQTKLVAESAGGKQESASEGHTRVSRSDQSQIDTELESDSVLEDQPQLEPDATKEPEVAEETHGPVGQIPDPEAKPKQKPAPKKRKLKAQWRDAATEVAEEHGLNPDEMHEAVEYIWQQKREHILEREHAKAAARLASGLTAGDLRRFENQGLDYSSNHPKLRDLDTIARSLASEYPILGMGSGMSEDSGYDSFDYPAALWEILREGRIDPPSRKDSGLLNEAAQFLKSSLNSYMTPEEEEELMSLPFQRDRMLYRHTRYSKSRSASSASLPDLIERIERAADQTELNPTIAQKQAGNYKKGRCSLHGMEITIETPAGATRSGVGPSGKPWSTVMPYHYGYIRKTESDADGDHIDIFLGPDLDSELVFVIDQVDLAGDFDEHKCMIGWKSQRAAKGAYLKAFSSGWKGFGSITPMKLEDFQRWIQEGNTAVPVSEQVKPSAEHQVLRYQSQQWREEDHPRDDSGKFAEKEGEAVESLEGKGQPSESKGKSHSGTRTDPATPRQVLSSFFDELNDKQKEEVLHVSWLNTTDEAFEDDKPKNVDEIPEDSLPFAMYEALVRKGNFFRFHWKDAPELSDENAYSRGWSTHGMADDDPELAVSRGYSCFERPESLLGYFELRGIPDGYGNVVIFQGRDTGFGDDDEDLAVPEKVIGWITWSDFETIAKSNPI